MTHLLVPCSHPSRSLLQTVWGKHLCPGSQHTMPVVVVAFSVPVQIIPENGIHGSNITV